MKTYFLKWYDGDDHRMTLFKINETQKNLLDKLDETVGFSTFVRNGDVFIEIVESTDEIIDCT